MATEEERKAAARERSRKYRERKRQEREEKAAALRDAHDAQPAVVLRASVEQAVAAMKWIQPSDRAAVDLALSVADQFDQLLKVDPGAVAKLSQLGNLVLRTLHELGGTPTVRLQHELRSLRLTAKTEGDDDGNGEEQASNVTRFERPAKRRGQAG